jgi:hypothetical protein
MIEKLTPKQQKAAVLLGCGNSCAATAKEIDVAVSTLASWRKTPEFAEAVRNALNKELVEAACESLQVLKYQLSSSNEYVRQNAARDLLTRYYTVLKENDSGTVHIEVVGMPELGMPTSE